MLKKHKIITDILDVGIVAIVRTDKTEHAEAIVRSCMEGGLSAVEVTFTVEGASKILERLATKEQKCILGAGTVLDAATARIAILSGASYIVSPSFDIETAKLSNRYAVPYMAGCYTPTEIVQALDYGVDVIKLFPSNQFVPEIISSLKAPLPQANFMPTGGININNAGEWIQAGAVALGVGGDLLAGAKNGDFSQITKQAIKYKQIVKEARSNR